MPNKTLNLLNLALHKREILSRSTNAMRLVNDIGDGLECLVLEQYNRHFVAQIFDRKWLVGKATLIDFVKNNGGDYFIAKDRTDSASSKKQSRQYHSNILALPVRSLWRRRENVGMISDSVKNGFKSEVWIDSGNSKTIVQENGLKFSVDLDDGLNSGLFLDMRHNRKVVGELARGRKVLNAFAYTCSFGVYCRAGGASEIVNVDVSQKILNRGKANYELNQISPAKNEFIRSDAVTYLERAVKKENRFDMIILDPPSFARHDGKTFSVKKDLRQLIDLAISVLNPNGFLFVATNFSELTHKHLESLIKNNATQRRVKKIQHLGQDVDFPGSGLTRLAGKVGQAPESYLAAVLAEI